MEPLNVAIVGAGAMGGVQAAAWRAVPETRIVAVTDVDPERRRALADETGAEAVDDALAAIDRPDVNVVSVCVPTKFHSELTILAAGRGKHVLCEKPPALTLAEVDEMRRTARDSGVQLMIGLTHRFFRTQTLARDLVADDRIGSPRHYINTSLLRIRPKIAMHDDTLNRGPVLDVLCHFADDATVVLGSRITRVYARGHVFAVDRPELAGIAHKAIDTASVVMDLENGDTFTWTVSWGLPPGVEGPTRQEVWGPKGVIDIRVNESVALIREDDTRTHTRLGVDPYGLEIAHFADCIRRNVPVVPGAAEGRAALQVCLAALESIRTGQPVELEAG